MEEVKAKSKEILISIACNTSAFTNKRSCLNTNGNSEGLSSAIRDVIEEQLTDKSSSLNTTYNEWKENPLRVERMLLSQVDVNTIAVEEVTEQAEALTEELVDRTQASGAIKIFNAAKSRTVLGQMYSLMEATDRRDAGCGEPVFFETTNRDEYACHPVTEIMTPKNLRVIRRLYQDPSQFDSHWEGNCSTFLKLHEKYSDF
jgi:hypothetical protein